MLIIDASVLVKAAIDQKDSERAAALVAENQNLAAPAHALAEVAEVLVRKSRIGDIDLEQATVAVRASIASTRFIPLPELMADAMRLSAATGASVYDCLYVAAAIDLDCRLVTADRRLMARLADTQHATLIIPLDSYSGSG